MTTKWWQYQEEGTYPGAVAIDPHGTVTVPPEARPGQTISVILEGTDDGGFPLTRYDRVFIRVL